MKNHMARYISDLLVNYNNEASLDPIIDFCKLNRSYSNCIQIINNCCYIPSTFGDFLKIEI